MFKGGGGTKEVFFPRRGNPLVILSQMSIQGFLHLNSKNLPSTYFILLKSRVAVIQKGILIPKQTRYSVICIIHLFEYYT